MKLTYWYAECISDNDCYSLIAKTKREAMLKYNERPKDFLPVEKRTIDYKDAFDLFNCATSEFGGRSLGSRG